MNGNPNQQHIPIKTELSERLRKAFHEAEPKELFMKDFSAVELRIIGNMTDEEIESFLKGPP